VIAGRDPGLQHPAKGAGGPPLVLLHGFLGAPASWQAVLDALPHHGPVWCPWSPGHGPAAPAPSSWQATVQALAAALPAGAVLAGYSMGARLALAAALLPGTALRATVLVGGHVGLATAAEREARAAPDARRAAALRAGPLEAFVTEWEALPLFASQQALPTALLAQQRAQRLAHDAQALAWAFDVAGLACMPDLRPAVAAARQPLHFLTGALDARFTALAATLARPPWVTHAVLPGAGHNLLLEAPAAVAASLAQWMESA
jgi:2-succinyl-6-hydroxy-2,4-cyclohexadiene-1-carboxylate synthase